MTHMLVRLDMRILARKNCVHKIMILFGIQDKKIKNRDRIMLGINIQDTRLPSLYLVLLMVDKNK